MPDLTGENFLTGVLPHLSTLNPAWKLCAHGAPDRTVLPGLQRYCGLLCGEGKGGETIRPAAQPVEQQMEVHSGFP